MAVPIVPLENTLAAVVTDTVAEVPVAAGTDKGTEEDEKLDSRAEMFLRRLTENVTKTVAELLNPTSPLADDEEEVEEVKKTRRKKRQAKAVPAASISKPRSILHTILG